MGKIVALLGQAGSGKDTVGKMIVDIVGRDYAQCIALADPLKEICKEVFDFSDEQLWGPSHMRNEPDRRYVRVAKGSKGRAMVGLGEDGLGIYRGYPYEDEYLTPRYALQTLGTEWGRACYPNVWIDLGIRRAQKLLAGTVNPDNGDVLVEPHKVVAITDCRFLNEAKAIRAAGGEVWRIVRPGAGAQGGVANHPSEMEQLDPEMDQYVTKIIINDSTLDDLRWAVKVVLGL